MLINTITTKLFNCFVGEHIDFLKEFDGNVESAVIHASVLLKTFLRSLGEPVITNDLYSELALLNG